MPGWLIPWLLPIVMVVAVIVAVAATPVIAALVLVLLGFVGVPFASATYRRTGGHERRERRPGWPNWLP
jgi:hypothetical protein